MTEPALYEKGNWCSCRMSYWQGSPHPCERLRLCFRMNQDREPLMNPTSPAERTFRGRAL
jgi:hypothetical protein